MNLSSHQDDNIRPNEKSPQFNKDENFIPLGFSSPIIPRQQTDEGNLYPSQQRNYEVYTANRRPNFRNHQHQRHRFHPGNRKSYENRGQQQYHSQYQPNQQQQQYKNRRFNQEQTPGKMNNSDMQSYFHPTMLEDPWKQLEANLERKRKDQSQSTEQSSSASRKGNQDDNSPEQQQSESSDQDE